MSKKARHIINIISAVLLTACLVMAFTSGVSCRAPLKCTGLKVVIADSSVNRFVSAADVKKFLDKEYGEYIGLPLDSIDLVKVESIIDGRSAVDKSQAFITRDGILNIKVTQRQPEDSTQMPKATFSLCKAVTLQESRLWTGKFLSRQTADTRERSRIRRKSSGSDRY